MSWWNYWSDFRVELFELLICYDYIEYIVYHCKGNKPFLLRVFYFVMFRIFLIKYFTSSKVFLWHCIYYSSCIFEKIYNIWLVPDLSLFLYFYKHETYNHLFYKKSFFCDNSFEKFSRKQFLQDSQNLQITEIKESWSAYVCVPVWIIYVHTQY